VTPVGDFPSLKHPNRRGYNWQMYNSGDRLLVENINYYLGDLYDLGCGEQPYRDWFLQYADTYTGVDWASTFHELKADVVADLNHKLPIKDEVANTVVSLSVMEHLQEPQMFLNEAFRILKPGGAMILQVPFMWWVHEAPHDYYRYTAYGLKYLFEKAGFTRIEVSPQTGFWVMWVLKLNYQSLRLIRGPQVVRTLITALLRVGWEVDQRLAVWLDKYWKSEGESAGYCVLARKL